MQSTEVLTDHLQASCSLLPPPSDQPLLPLRKPKEKGSCLVLGETGTQALCALASMGVGAGEGFHVESA